MANFPQRFGPYTLHELIARGGMAEVYRATMPGAGGFEKTVAIKKILPHLAENEEFIAMLVDEARIIVGLNHANIAQVYDLGCIDDTYYIAMEYVHSVDLADIVKESKKAGKTVPIPHAVYIASCVCAGLHVAHSKSDEQGRPLHIVHRDVSPHNVLISFGGDVKVIDFGVAKARGKETHTKAGVIKGKLLYMAPEQAMAKEIDGRADLFAVGIILYNMLTNHLPFDGENEFQIYNNILSRDITPPRAFNPEIPEELNQVIMMMLQRDPDKRYQDGYTCKIDLDRVLHFVAPGYSINRLSAWVEDSFLPIVQARRQRKDSAMGQSGPQTPSNPMANHTGPSAQMPAPNFPQQTPAWPAPAQTPAMHQGWVQHQGALSEQMPPSQSQGFQAYGTPAQTSQNFPGYGAAPSPAHVSQSFPAYGAPQHTPAQSSASFPVNPQAFGTGNFAAIPAQQVFQTQVSADQTGQFESPKRRLPILPLVGSVLAVVLIGAMIFVNLTKDDANAAPVPVVPIEEPSVPIDEQVPEEPTLAGEPAEVEAVEPAEVIEEEVVDPVEPVEEVDLVKISIESNPPGATVLMGGEDKGVTPFSLEIQRAADVIPVEVILDGYESDGFRLVPADDTTRVFELKKTEEPSVAPVKATPKQAPKQTPKKTTTKTTQPKKTDDDVFSIPLLDDPPPVKKTTKTAPKNQDDLMNPFE